MRKILFLSTLIAAAFFVPATAHAGHSHWGFSLGLNFPIFGGYYAAPHYYDYYGYDYCVPYSRPYAYAPAPSYYYYTPGTYYSPRAYYYGAYPQYYYRPYYGGGYGSNYYYRDRGYSRYNRDGGRYRYYRR